MNNIVIVFLLSVVSIGAMAQEQKQELKVGYADVDYILEKMPATKKIQEEIKVLETQLARQFELKQTEFKTKYDQFLKAEETKSMLGPVRENTIRELQMLEANLEKFQQQAQASLQKRYGELSDPVFKSVGEAIEAVAKENGFTYILNPKINGMDAVLFADEKWDISDLVLKKLGVAPGVVNR